MTNYIITASIVTFKNSIAELTPLLNSVFTSAINQVYIIDNSPNDNLRELQLLSDKINYIHSKNLGYGSGHNIAIRKAIEQKSYYHVVLNPDIEFQPETISRIAEYMDQDFSIAQLMPKIIYPNGDLQYLCKLIPTPIDLIFKRFLPSNLLKTRLYKFQLRFTEYRDIMNVPYLSGCFMFFRTSALKEIGLFDERFFMYPEDIDITRRMHSKYKTIYYPEITVIHAHAAESYKSKKMLWIHIWNMIKYFNKWGWFFDQERQRTNSKILKELNYKKP